MTELQFDENIDTSDEDVETTDEPNAEEKKASATKRTNVPDGYITPIAFKNELVKEGKVAEDFRPQMAYQWVKNPGKNDPFPVKWTDGTNVFDTKAEAGESARPVVKSEEAHAWFARREQRKTEKANAPKTTASKPATAEATEAEESDDGLQEFSEAE